MLNLVHDQVRKIQLRCFPFFEESKKLKTSHMRMTTCGQCGSSESERYISGGICKSCETTNEIAERERKIAQKQKERLEKQERDDQWSDELYEKQKKYDADNRDSNHKDDTMTITTKQTAAATEMAKVHDTPRVHYSSSNRCVLCALSSTLHLSLFCT